MATINTLKDRILSYQEAADHKLLTKLPVIVIINGRSFNKVTSMLPKPYCPKFMEAMSAVMIKLAHEVDGSTFLYSFNDEIVLIMRNDQSNDTEAWYENRIQKIASSTASIATLQFTKTAISLGLDISGDPIFSSQCFVVPNVTEAINCLVFKQQQAVYNSISSSAFHELLKSHDAETVKDTLYDRTTEEKLDILIEECGVDYNKYPSSFRRGIACYRVPKLMQTRNGEIFKHKWTVDTEIPIFTKDHNFLGNIFKSGRDIFRADRDI